MLNTPKLRFKDKNGNAYPEWEERKIGDICKTFSGGTPSITNTSYYNGDIPFIKSGEIHSCETEMTITEAGLKNSSAKLVSKGDLLFALYGATSGDVDISKIDGAINQAILCIRSENMNLLFLKNLFSLYKEQILCKYLQGGQGNLSAEIIKSLMFFLPCLEEQEKIAGFLSKVDELINECESEVKDLEEQKKGLMQKIFSQQIRFKDSNNDPYPDWKEKKIEDIATLTSSKRIHASDYVPKGIPFYRGKEITELKTNKKISELLYISEDIYDEYKMKYGAPQKNDILVTAVGTLGNVWAVDNEYPFYFKDGNLIWFKYVKENSKFIEYLLLSPKGKKKLLNSAIGSNQKALTIVGINKLHFKFPCQEEQEKIAKVLSKIDELIEEKKELLSDWQQFKKGLLQQMFV